MTRQQMLDSRAKAGHREQPDALSYGQRAILWPAKEHGGDHRWHAQVVLVDGTRVFLDEEERAPRVYCGNECKRTAKVVRDLALLGDEMALDVTRRGRSAGTRRNDRIGRLG